MKLLVLSDVHGEVDNFDKLDAQFKAADAVVFAGDFARFNEPETGLPALEKLLDKHGFVYAVTGNCDPADFVETLEEKDISIEGRLASSDGLCWLGSGGGLQFTGTTPNERTDDDLITDLRAVTENAAETSGGTADGTVDGSAAWGNLILVTHQPAFDSKMDIISSGVPTGSKNFKAFIEKYQPLAAISGHIHESFAVGNIGKTVVMNPGALAEGRYGTIELVREGGAWSVKSAELHQL